MVAGRYGSPVPDGPPGLIYKGPLPTGGCMHGRHRERLLGVDKRGRFRTASTTAYLLEFCIRMARHFVAEMTARKLGQLGSAAPQGRGPGTSGVPMYAPIDLFESEVSGIAEAIIAASGSASQSLAAGLFAYTGGFMLKGDDFFLR